MDLKARLPPGALLAILLFVAVVAGPWFLGQRAERVYREGLAVVQSQPHGLRVVSEVYRRGWFGSEASVELTPAAGDLSEDLRVRIDSRIDHGPRTLSDLTWPPALARVASTVDLDHPKVHLAGVQADARIGWDGDGLIGIALPAMNQPASRDGPGLRTAPGHGELRFGPGTGRIAAILELPSLEVLGEGGTSLLTLRDVHAENSTTPWLPGLDIGSGNLSVAEVRAHGPDGGLAAQDLSLSVRSRPEGGLLDIHLSYRARVLRIDGADYAPSQAEFSATRLDGATLAALQQDMEGLSAQNLPEAMGGIATAALMMKHLPALAAVNPGVAMDRLDIATPSGPVTGRLALGVQGLTATDLSGQGTWLRRLVGDGELSLPRAVALALLTQVQRQKALETAADAAPGDLTPEQEQAMADAAAEQIDDLLQEGWIGADGERLRTVLKLADGLLTVNGKTLPLGGALPL
jgi:uncharacterized protein YdgA (DUF945 family)